ncbi:MAG: nucleoid-associated protein [Bacteroidales bacterium]|nr:nucleoid-associated protein [Bacteroidales bacterium]
MIFYDDTSIEDLCVHRIAEEDNESILNANAAGFAADKSGALKTMFLKPFANQVVTCEFAHEVDVKHNVLFNLARELNESGNFDQVSLKIAQHLVATSKHHNINEGDLFIAKFNDLYFNGDNYNALGIYKYEDKENFIETWVEGGRVNFKFRNGIGSKKPDKACLVIFTTVPYTLFIIEDRGGQTDYWQNEFVKHKPKNDFVNNTSDALTLTKEFITKQVPQEYQVTKTEQIDLLNRSIDYFKTHSQYNKNEFEEAVFQDPGMIDAYRKYDNNYQKENALEIKDQFEISPMAVKKQNRVYKSVLKLDKNFHVYIHGNTDLIEKGTDKDGRKFYKIYYEEER